MGAGWGELAGWLPSEVGQGLVLVLVVVVVSGTELWVVTGTGVLVGVSMGSVEQRVVVVRVTVLVRVTGMVAVWVPEVTSEEVTRNTVLDRFHLTRVQEEDNLPGQSVVV